MKTTAGILFLFAAALMLSSCSTPKETVKEETPQKDSVYVFDQVPEETKTEQPAPPEVSYPYYVVQVGAFSTKEKADTFSELFKQKFTDELSTTFSNEKNLYLVQLVQKYSAKPDAEKKRDQIKLSKEFADVWIVTINK